MSVPRRTAAWSAVTSSRTGLPLEVPPERGTCRTATSCGTADARPRGHRFLCAVVHAIQRVLDVRAECLTRQKLKGWRKILAGQALAEVLDVAGVGVDRPFGLVLLPQLAREVFEQLVNVVQILPHAGSLLAKFLAVEAVCRGLRGLLTGNKCRSGAICAPGRNRTCDLGIRRPLLYPTELRRQSHPPWPKSAMLSSSKSIATDRIVERGLGCDAP